MDKNRYVMVSIDTITELFKDYCGPEDIPEDAMPVQLLLRPTENGKLALELTSDSYAHGLPPLNLTFSIRRMHTV